MMMMILNTSQEEENFDEVDKILFKYSLIACAHMKSNSHLNDQELVQYLTTTFENDYEINFMSKLVGTIFNNYWNKLIELIESDKSDVIFSDPFTTKYVSLGVLKVCIKKVSKSLQPFYGENMPLSGYGLKKNKMVLMDLKSVFSK